MGDPEARQRATELWQEGCRLQMAGDLERAIETYRRSIEVCPTAEAHTYLAWLADVERRQRQLTDIKQKIEEHRSGLPLVLVTHGSVVTDLTGLSIRMGEFVVLQRGPDGGHAVAGQLYIE